MEMNETMRNEMENTTKEVIEEVSSNTNDIRVLAITGIIGLVIGAIGYRVYKKKKSNKNVVVTSEEYVEDENFKEFEEDEEDK